MNVLMKKLLKILLWISGIWVALLILAEILLSSGMTTDAINRYASEYIDGELRFGRIKVSTLRNFPHVCLTLEDFSVTYPADRFDRLEKQGPQGHLMYHGNGEAADTLASFSNFSISINPVPLIMGKIHIPEVELVKPRIFAHSYDDGSANWDIFITPEKTDTASGSPAEMPQISIGKIRLTEHPHIIYTSSRDTIFAMIDIKKAGFNGRLTTGKTSRNRIGLQIDSMFVAGRLSADTVALGLERLHIHEHGRHADFHAKANATAATRSFGRIRVPVEMNATVHIPKDTVPAMKIQDFRAEIAAIPVSGNMHLRFMDGKTGIDGKLAVDGAEVQDILKRFVRGFIPEADKIDTDAFLFMEAECHDEFVHGSGKLPQCRLNIRVPESSVSYRDIPQDIRLAVAAAASIDKAGKADIESGKVVAITEGLDLNIAAKARNLLGEDPLFEVDGNLSACLDSLGKLLPDSLDINASGTVNAVLQGKAKMSHLDLYSFSQSDMTGSISADSIIFNSPSDTIDINIRSLKADLGPETITSRRDPKRSFRLMGITGNIGAVNISLKESMTILGENVGFSAKNSADPDKDTSAVKRLSGRVSAESLSVTDKSGTSIELDKTTNGFLMRPKRGNPKVPMLTLTSSNKRITLGTPVNRAILTDASVKASAAMNTVERRQKMRHFMDSLANVHPEVPRDSLMYVLRAQRRTIAIPEWLKEEDFRQNDIHITLNDRMKKYFRDWDLDGNINIRTGIVMTPYFPVRNILRGCDIKFTNDRVAIDSFKVMSGNSDIAAKGELKGLRRAVLGRGTMKLGLDIMSEKINANELLGAFSTGSRFTPEAESGKLAGASNAEFFQMVTVDSLEHRKEESLLVIPANLNADITLNAKDIRYNDLLISGIHADMTMKERCVQITNTSAQTNMGGISFEGFYATRTKQDIRAGFNINFKDITAEKAISLMPAVDTIMPLLKSFAGNLNCDIAATASLDTNMNIVMPSINGILRISGKNLTVRNSEMFTSLAKKLKFNNSKVGKIKKMTVEGVIQDNILEVFPFVLSLDRYTIALSGKQNFDKSFKYHASLIRSPILIKVGVDLYGKDFDHMKFKIGKPKYKSEKVPVFSTVIDKTKINLTESIRNIFEKGVEAAVKENERQEDIARHKQDIGYVNAVDQQFEELSDEEKMELEKQEEVQENNTNTTETVIEHLESTEHE